MCVSGRRGGGGGVTGVGSRERKRNRERIGERSCGGGERRKKRGITRIILQVLLQGITERGWDGRNVK